MKAILGYCLRLLLYLLWEPIFRLTGRRGMPYAREAVRRILVVRLDEIGDQVLTSPFLRELRRLFPQARITLVVKPAVVNLVERCPYVDEVLAFDAGIRQRFGHLKRFARAWRFAGPLRGRRFDLAALPRWDADYYHALPLAYLTGARWRVGFSERVLAEKRRHDRGADRLLTCAVDERGVRHEVERHRALIRRLGGDVAADRLELWLDAQDHAAADALLRAQGWQPGGLLIGVGPAGGSSELKQWPLERFIAVIAWLREHYGAQVVLVGGPGEEALGRRLAGALPFPVIDTIAKTTLRQMAAILARTRLYLGNDTGPLHIAAAAGVPVVAIFGPSCRHRFGPWSEQAVVLQHLLPCHPCAAHDEHDVRCPACTRRAAECLRDVTVADVQAAIAAQLSAALTATEKGENR